MINNNLREKKKLTSLEIFNNNKILIDNLAKRRKLSEGKFWKPFLGEYDKSKEVYYNASRKNHYEEVVNELRQKYLKDKDHFYTYSNRALTLSFPMIDRDRNEAYLNYEENKKKWVVPNDFDRYKQPVREKVYFPKINNVL